MLDDLPTLNKKPALPEAVKNRSSIAVFDNKGAGYDWSAGNTKLGHVLQVNKFPQLKQRNDQVA